MITLYGRHQDLGPLTRIATFPTYRAAVEKGQQLFGYGNFNVDTGIRVPTRDEQLLTEDKRTTFLATL